MKKFTAREIFTVGLTMFSIFFGAGNLIFPPTLGLSAGSNLWWAGIGFLLTAVSLPLMGVLVNCVIHGNNGNDIGNKVHPKFSVAINVITYLLIGPIFATPRTAAVSYDIAIVPFLSSDFSHGLLIYSIIYFTISYFLAKDTNQMIKTVGNILSPILLFVLLILLGTTFLMPLSPIAKPVGEYISSPLVKGALEGYLTMDTLASIIIGSMLYNSIKNAGGKNEIVTKKEINRVLIRGALIGGTCLAAIYIGLVYLGATSNVLFLKVENGSVILACVSNAYFGLAGNVVLGIVIFFACLPTSVGLISSVSEYFNSLTPSISFEKYVLYVSMLSCFVANFGLNKLIILSVPVLVTVYPIIIVLLALTYTDRFFDGRNSVYIFAVVTTGIVSALDGLRVAGFLPESITTLLSNYIPFFTLGVGWIVPALLAAIAGYLCFSIFNFGRL